MNKYLLTGLFLLGLGSACAQSNYIDLVWSDEFNVDGAPNAANWGYDLGYNNGWGNAELQTYTNSNDNVRVENGVLVIEARKNNGNWTSARLKSQGKKNFTYGRIVFRAKLPQGSGTWPALWMLGESVSSAGWPACGEIDVMEHVGKAPGLVHGSLHSPSSYGATQNTGTTNVSSYNTAFHDYEVLWTPDKIQFSVDGNPYYTYQPATKNSSTWPFNTPFFLIMNIAMGGNFGSDPQYESNNQRNGVDPTLSLARMEVDYVRVYQSFSALTLAGPSRVEKNQNNITFTTNQLEGATYVWTVPADATITSGNGTSSIQLKWGETEGPVSVKVTFGGQTQEKTINVTHVITPDQDRYALFAPNFDITWNDGDAVNTYTATSANNILRVDYQVTTPSTSPSLVGTLYRALNLTNHPILHVRARSSNKSKSLLMRMDLVDENGLATSKPPVFNLSPVIDDGDYYDYTFNFASTNNWQSSQGAVNNSRITAINFYIDYGTFGTAGKDSLWVENIWVETPGIQTTLPNRPSNLTGKMSNGSMVLSWKDNASNETGFEIVKAALGTTDYATVTTVAANTTTATLNLGGADPEQFLYRVRATHTNGSSPYSNIFDPRQLITAVDDEPAHTVVLYPNPTRDQLTIQYQQARPHQVRIYSALGIEQLRFSSVTAEDKLNLPNVTPGLYIVEIITEHQRTTHKFIVR